MRCLLVTHRACSLCVCLIAPWQFAIPCTAHLFAPRGSNDPKSGGEWWAILDKLAAEELMFCTRVQVEMCQR